MIWLKLAVRNALANRRRSLIAAGSIALVAIALMVSGGYVREVREGMKMNFIKGQGTGHLQLRGQGGFGDFEETPLAFGVTPAQRTAIETAGDKDGAVRRVVPRLQFGGMISSGPRTLAFSGSAVDPTLEKTAFGMANTVKAGQPLERRSPDDGIVIGVEMAKQLGVKPGDSVTILTPTVHGGLNGQDMQVLGTRSTGSAQGDLYYLQAKLETIQKLMATDRVSSLTVLLDDKAEVAAAMARLKAASPGLDARDWMWLQPQYKQVIGMFSMIFAVFGTVVIVVTLMGVALMILTSVLERSKEIGVMRSLGVAARQVRSAFVLEGLALCLAGLVCGGVAAQLIIWAVNGLHLTAPPPPGSNTGYPIRLLWDWTVAIEVAVAVIVLGAAASWLTSGRVAKLKVVQALGAL